MAKCLLPVASLCWGDLSPRGVRIWSWIFWLLSWPFLAGKRRVVRTNLRIAFPELAEGELEHLCQKNILHILGMGLDWLHFLKHPEDATARLDVSEEFRRECSQANPQGKYPSALYCTLHLGNWEVASRLSYVTGRPGAVVVARFKLDFLNDLARRLRTEGDDTEVIPAHGAAYGVMRALMKGRNVGILIDQNVSPRDGGIFRKFFGLPATASRLPAAIARHLQVPVYVASCIKDSSGRFHMEYESLEKDAWEYASDEELTGAIFAAYEQLIRRHPEQYLWSYTRWRYIPANAKSAELGKYPFYASQKKYECPEELLS